MPVLKATLLFQEGPFGWSESYYQTSADLDTFQPFAVNLLKGRATLLHDHVSIVGIRMSDPLVFRDSRFLSTNDPAIIGITPGQVAGDVTEVDVALLFRIEAGTLRRRGLLLRGCPEGIVNGLTTPASYNRAFPGWLPAVDVFRKCLTGQNFLGVNAGNWQLYSLDVLANTPLVPAATSIVHPSGKGFSFITASTIKGRLGNPATALGPGDAILIKGAANTRGVNGKWVIASITPVVGPPAGFTYDLFDGRHLVAIPGLATPFNVRALWYVGANIDRLMDERLSDRETGRPFGLARGRRRARQ